MYAPISPTAKAEMTYNKARALLVLDHPFFASIVLRKPMVWTGAIPTAGIKPDGSIFLNPKFIETLTVAQVVFLLAHEAMHYMLLHGLRRGSRNPGAWNIAGDAVINDTLIAAGVGSFIEGGVLHAGARDKKTEDLYVEPPKDGGGGGGDGPTPGGPGSDILEEGGTKLTDGEIAEIEAQIKVDAAQAKQAAKMAGKMPAALERLVDALINVKTPWYTVLERHMAAYRKDDYSWSRPNRRFIGQDIYLPGQNYVPEMGAVVIGVDTSGSIGQHELDHFSGHVSRIIEECRPTEVHIVYCDAHIAGTEKLTAEDMPIKLKALGGGGTSFRPVFDWVDEQGISPDVLVYLTDLYGDQSSLQYPGYPVVWLSTSDRTDVPFGDVVPYEVTD